MQGGYSFLDKNPTFPTFWRSLYSIVNSKVYSIQHSVQYNIPYIKAYILQCRVKCSLNCTGCWEDTIFKGKSQQLSCLCTVRYIVQYSVHYSIYQYILVLVLVSEYLTIFRDMFETRSQMVPIVFPPLVPSNN